MLVAFFFIKQYLPFVEKFSPSSICLHTLRLYCKVCIQLNVCATYKDTAHSAMSKSALSLLFFI